MDDPVRLCGDDEGRTIVFPESAISDINAHPLCYWIRWPHAALWNPTLPLVSLLACCYEYTRRITLSPVPANWSHWWSLLFGFGTWEGNPAHMAYYKIRKQFCGPEGIESVYLARGMVSTQFPVHALR